MKKKVEVDANMVSTKINARWFESQLEGKGMSKRKLAAILGVQPSAIIRLLDGTRRLRPEEAVTIANQFGSTVEEVLEKAGIKVANIRSDKLIPIKGWIDGNLMVHWEAPKGIKTAPQPSSGGGKDLSVLRFQTAGDKLEGMDGALVYFRSKPGIDLNCIGKTSIVTLQGGKESYYCFLRHSYDKGKFNLCSASGALMKEDVLIETANLVNWIKM